MKSGVLCSTVVCAKQDKTRLEGISSDCWPVDLRAQRKKQVVVAKEALLS
jgi:hypothetical protein